MRKICMLLAVPFYAFGASSDSIPTYYQKAAKTIVAAQPRDHKAYVDSVALAAALKKTSDERLADEASVQALEGVGSVELSATSVLLLHTTGELLRESESRQRSHTVQLRRQQQRFEQEAASKQTMQNYIFALSSIVCVVLGLVLGSGC